MQIVILQVRPCYDSAVLKIFDYLERLSTFTKSFILRAALSEGCHPDTILTTQVREKIDCWISEGEHFINYSEVMLVSKDSPMAGLRIAAGVALAQSSVGLKMGFYEILRTFEDISLQLGELVLGFQAQ